MREKRFLKYFLPCLGSLFLLFMSLAFVLMPGTTKALASPDPGWERQLTITNGMFTSISAIDESTAWAAATSQTDTSASGIYKTANGGTSWTLQLTGTNAVLSAVDASTVYAVASTALYKTTDGGTTWNMISDYSSRLSAKAIHALDANNVLLVGSISNQGFVARSSDGGTSWFPLYSGPPDSNVEYLSAPNPEVMWVGERIIRGTTPISYTILRTTDGGASWNQVSPAPDGESLDGAVSAIDADTAWACSNPSSSTATTGHILKTMDGGATWVQQYPFSGYGISSITSIDADVIWATGGSIGSAAIIIKTTDGGASWASQSVPYANMITGMSAVNPCVAWATGFAFSPSYKVVGYVFRTTDGGDPSPDILSISPDKGTEGTEVTITGCNFGATQGTSYVSFGAVEATDYVSWSDTQVVVRAPAGISSPARVTVTTALGTSNGKSFQVTAPAPTVTSVAPTQAGQFDLWVSLQVKGTGFQPGATLSLEQSGNSIDASTVSVDSDTQITASSFLFGAATGTYDVVVTNPDGGAGRLAGGFNITSPCGSGSGSAVLMLGLTLGLLSLGAGGLRVRRKRNQQKS
jgi:photosystem II stability/assembly factor-like uncharacterized protein